MCGACSLNLISTSSRALGWLTESSIILIILSCERKFAPEVVDSTALLLTKIVAVVYASVVCSKIVGSSTSLGSSVVL